MSIKRRGIVEEEWKETHDVGSIYMDDSDEFPAVCVSGG